MPYFFKALKRRFVNAWAALNGAPIYWEYVADHGYDSLFVEKKWESGSGIIWAP